MSRGAELLVLQVVYHFSVEGLCMQWTVDITRFIPAHSHGHVNSLARIGTRLKLPSNLKRCIWMGRYASQHSSNYRLPCSCCQAWLHTIVSLERGAVMLSVVFSMPHRSSSQKRRRYSEGSLYWMLTLCTMYSLSPSPPLSLCNHASTQR
jgi:hypothetical protein